jgi:phage shock protein PspC (stress-responsive transcriptional regulator)
MKKLYKSLHDRKWLGVCGGLAEYLELDSTVIRILWIFISLFFSAIIGGLIMYLIMAIIMKYRPYYEEIIIEKKEE